MKIKTSELEGSALDWATGVSLGHKVQHSNNVGGLSISEPYSKHDRFIWSPSADWSQGGPLISKYEIEFAKHPNGLEAFTQSRPKGSVGSGHLIAACRAIVDAKLGEELEVPDELIQPST